MCALNSPDDHPASSYTAADLAFDLRLHLKRVEALALAVNALAFEGKSLDEACGRAGLQELCRLFEGSTEGFREGLCLALTGREPPRGNAPALVAAAREFMEEREIAAGLRPRDPLATAMRRVDAVEAAERSLIDRAHAVGAELARLDAVHCYGRSAAPAPAHSTHEAGFHSPAAA